MVSEIRFCICQPVNLKGNKPWILIGRTDAEAEAPVFWSPDANSWLIGKVPGAGKFWGQKEKRVSEDEMAGWHHWCNGHELGQTLGDDEGQGGLMCCSPWACKELDTTRWLNSNICLFKKFIFNWKVIALQYYVGFYQTSTWISHSLYMS